MRSTGTGEETIKILTVEKDSTKCNKDRMFER